MPEHTLLQRLQRYIQTHRTTRLRHWPPLPGIQQTSASSPASAVTPSFAHTAPSRYQRRGKPGKQRSFNYTVNNRTGWFGTRIITTSALVQCEFPLPGTTFPTQTTASPAPGETHSQPDCRQELSHTSVFSTTCSKEENRGI